MIKKWNQFNEKLEYNDGISSIDDLQDIFRSGIQVTIFLKDLISGTGIIIVTKSGKVFEKSKSDDWVEYKSVEDFENKTGASLDNEYASNRSQKLLDLIVGDGADDVGIDDYRIDDIEAIYFEGEPSDVLKKLLNNIN